MDELEYDIYDDLDVFKGNEKQQKECESCAELREQLNSVKQQNVQLKTELNEIEKNFHALLQTSRQEIQRKDARIKDLQKEKDDICFRRKMVKHCETKHATTQSTISCKPFQLYELKSVENDPIEKPAERNSRHDENHKNHTNTNTNPFASKLKENHEIKGSNYVRSLEKNSAHRHQSARHQDDHSSQDDRSLRSKHNNHRSKENERREQNNVERPKRKRSPSASKDLKRMRRSRSRSRDRPKKERNVPERSSPEKVSRSLKTKEPNEPKDKSNGSKEQHKRKRTLRSPAEHDLRYTLRNKREKGGKNGKNESSDNHSNRQITENHMEPSKVTPNDQEIADEIIPTRQTPESAEPEKVVNGTDALPSNVHALEEGEIVDSSNDSVDNIKRISHEVHNNEITSANNKVSHTFTGKFEDNIQNCIEVIEAEKEISDVPKLVAVDITPTAEVHIPCATPIVSIEYDCVEQQEEQKQPHQEQHDQLLNGTANNAVEETQMEEKQFIGISIEAQSLDQADVNKVEAPIVNEPELNDKVKNENQQASVIAETPVLPIPENNQNDEKPPEVEKELEVPLENNSPRDATIPKTNDSPSDNSSESHKTTEPIDDSSTSIHNTSGGKSVNISTSNRDYLIVEDENNEHVIYVTRKKKKKKKEKKKSKEPV